MKDEIRRLTRPFPAAAGLAVAAVIALAAPAAAQDDWGDDWDDEASEPAVEIHGFVEGSAASRVTSDPTARDDYVLGEARFRLSLSHYGERAELSLKSDFISDAVTNETTVDVRQAWLSMQAGSWLDIRVGRQVLTWGTGDLVFLNDLFPKDFVSFFVGRSDEFLKAPSNTLKLSAYTDLVDIDLALTPVFAPDRHITGERLSFYDPMAGRIVRIDSTGHPSEAVRPARTLENGELALRLHKTVGGYEVAAYGYRGYFKQPRAFDEASGKPTYSRLVAAGASVRGNAAGGIANVEGSYYYSRDDSDGDNPTIPNSEVRGLVGFEREVVADVTLGLQYYVEWLQDYDRLVAASPAPERAPEETRQTVTARLAWRLMQETLTLSLFGFVAAEDGDTHWRPSVTRQWSDAVTVSLGANVMTGEPHTFFGQLEDNSNAYLRFRYSF